MTDLASLVVRLEAETSKYQQGFERATAQLAKFHSDVDSHLTAITGAFENFGSAIVAAFGVKEIAEFADQALKNADALYLLSQRTGFTAEGISELGAAFRTVGVGSDQLGTSLGRMQDAITKGNPAFSELGVSLDKLKTLSPETQFDVLAEAISRLPDPAEKSYAALELFGRAGTELLPILNQGAAGVEKLREQAVQMGQSLSTADLTRLHTASASIDQMHASFEALATTLVSKVSPGITAVADTLRRLAGGSTDIEKLTQQLTSLQTQLTSGRASASALPGIQAGIESTKAQIEALKSASNAPAQLPSGVFALDFSDSFKQIDDFTKASGAGSREAANDFDELANSIAASMHRSNQALDNFRDGYAAMLASAQANTQTSVEAIVAEWNLKDEQIKTLLDAGAIDQAEAAKRTSEIFDSYLQPVTVKINDFAKQSAKSISQYATQAAQGVQNAFENFLIDPFKDGLKGMLTSFIELVEKMTAEATTAKIFGPAAGGGLGGKDAISSFFNNWVFGGTPAFTPDFGSIDSTLALSGITLPGLASGGSMHAGSNYIVGEDGPEIFTPGASGAITPNDALGGGIHITQNVDARGATVDAIQLLPSAMKQASDNAIARVVDMKRRGQI